MNLFFFYIKDKHKICWNQEVKWQNTRIYLSMVAYTEILALKAEAELLWLLKASLRYVVSTKPAWATERVPVSQN